MDTSDVLIDLGRGYTAIVTAATYARLGLADYEWKPQIHKRAKKVYAYCNGRYGPIYLHRLLLGAVAGQYVDHADGDGLNNRDCNLRLCKAGQNSANQKRHRDAQCRYKGIWRANRKWAAQIVFEGKRKHLGVYGKEELAARAYDVAAVRYFGEFASLNFPHLLNTYLAEINGAATVGA